MERASGVLMHISSLGGDFGIGSFGDDALRFIDSLKDAGFKWWQVLPFCPVDECNSPYKSHGSFGGNHYFVDLKKLYEKGLLTKEELDESRQKQPYSCEYERLSGERLELLKMASMRVENREEIEKFAATNKYVEEFCTFMALKEANEHKEWTKWQNQTPDEDVLFMHKFIQYEFSAQWAQIKEYANSCGIKIIGDIPIYVSHDSADVWAHKELFLLEDDGSPSKVAGVPPDYFCEDGQLWGNPIYNWEAMQKDGFKWWMDRMQFMFSMFDGVRIDHFRGIESYWSVPASAKTAREGTWEKGPGVAFVDALNKVKGDNLIIAEDLGVITEDVAKLVKYSGFPGMRVFQFGFLGEINSPHAPHNYTESTIAYTGTHDNNTLLGYVWELSESDRASMLDYLGFDGNDWNKCYDSVFRSIYMSRASIVIFPVQDLLGYGADTRLNTPGRADGNWSFRITKDQLNSVDWSKFKKYNRLYGR